MNQETETVASRSGGAQPPDRLVDLLRLAEQATPGPWRSGEKGTAADGIYWEVMGPQWQVGREWMVVDAAYIAAASPDVILALLSERQALMAALGCVSPSVWDERYDGDPVFDKARSLLSSSGGDKDG